METKRYENAESSLQAWRSSVLNYFLAAAALLAIPVLAVTIISLVSTPDTNRSTAVGF